MHSFAPLQFQQNLISKFSSNILLIFKSKFANFWDFASDSPFSNRFCIQVAQNITNKSEAASQLRWTPCACYLFFSIYSWQHFNFFAIFISNVSFFTSMFSNLILKRNFEKFLIIMTSGNFQTVSFIFRQDFIFRNIY